MSDAMTRREVLDYVNAQLDVLELKCRAARSLAKNR